MSERYRPVYHFTPLRNWMNDPNGLVYFDREYHLFYQYNPQGDTWGHMSWAHAVSRDLLHWEHLPLALPEENGVMIFSGSAVVDWNNTSGFGPNGQPPLVAIYTGHHTEKPLQNQNLAFSHDRGRSWTKYPGNPVLDIGDAEFRDPKVFWHESTRRWVMVVSRAVLRKVSFYVSSDLKSWMHAGDFGPAGSTVGIWECPDLFPLAVDGDDARMKWVLLLNVNPGAPGGGSGCQYFIGDFDGTRFVLDEAQNGALWLDYGADFYAAVSWSDLPTRRVILGWMNNWPYANQVPTQPWRGVMSIPRELELRSTPAGPRLAQFPVRELLRQRAVSHEFRGALGDVAARLSGLAVGDAFEVELDIEKCDAARTVTLSIHSGSAEQTDVTWSFERGELILDRTRSGQAGFAPDFAARHCAPVQFGGRTARLRVLVDRCSVEVFADYGRIAITDLIFPTAGPASLSLSCDGPAPSVHAAVHRFFVGEAATA